MQILIINGYVIDPKGGREGQYDVLVENGRIKSIRSRIDPKSISNERARVIDAYGKYIMPGFIDLHVHLREPGYEYKETIRTGSMAAAAGGFTTICPMPNTKPAMDHAKIIKSVLQKAGEALINILPIGAITCGQEGKELTDIPGLVRAGAVAISEDGKSVMDTALYEKAMRMAKKLNIPVFAHCEDRSLAGDGVINAGAKAEKLGLPGITNATEDVIVARDILLAEETGVKLHLCHCSTKGSTVLLSRAKEAGLPVTGETCPHYFTLSDQDIPGENTDYKMNPPLRSPEDVKAVREALKKGILEVIATDHAPHSCEEKARSMKEAPFGIVGLETAFSLTLTKLVRTGILTPSQMVEKLSVNPANILGIDRGSLGEGCVADLVIADPEDEYIIDRNSFLSKGRNTPFHGSRVSGRILYTMVAGKIVYEYVKI